ncbi:MAG: UDP-N-acetylmuramate dehydrogenase [Sporolactobacillus sp.]
MMTNDQLYQSIVPFFQSKVQIKQDEPLSHYTFTHTGGKADIFVMPVSVSEVVHTINFASSKGIPVTIIGRGSNIIVRDGGVRGIVVQLGGLNQVKRADDERIIAQCGANLIDVSQFACDAGLSGLEFACGIPGSVGGAIYMNAGAYGGETAQFLESVLVLDKAAHMHRLTRSELAMGYRRSAVSENGYLALEGTFALRRGDRAAIAREMSRLTLLREQKQPLEYPSCGSVFKRPPGHYAGQLIQESGLQGVRVGGVEVSTKHAGFMVNVDHGTATDYLNLIHLVQQTVKAKFGVNLETEVRIVGED